MSIEEQKVQLTRHVLNGETMGTRYSAIFYAAEGLEIKDVDAALYEAVNRVDCQMSTWKPESDLMQLNAAQPGEWVDTPHELMLVLQKSLAIGRQSYGAFDIGLGSLVNAWGFGPNGNTLDTPQIKDQLGRKLDCAHDIFELDIPGKRARKLQPIQLDLSGIAKGFAVDEMTQCLCKFEVEHALVSLDGELRAKGRQSGTMPWSVAVESPEYDKRSALGVISLEDASIATSGDYRHWVELGKNRLSHTMDRQVGGPVSNKLASVTVVADDCIEADAWATVLLVLGEVAGPALARARNMDALFLARRADGIEQIPVGDIFTFA